MGFVTADGIRWCSLMGFVTCNPAAIRQLSANRVPQLVSHVDEDMPNLWCITDILEDCGGHFGFCHNVADMDQNGLRWN